MVRKLVPFWIVACLLLPNSVWGVTDQDFQVATSQSLLSLCTASQNDPLYKEAINFCHGYLVGAYAYYSAVNCGPGGDQLVCLPDPPPSRAEAIKMFVEWLKSHPEYSNDKPVDSEFRFLMEKWPCKH